MLQGIMMKIISILCLSIFYTCCSLITKEECQQQNWYEKGNKDGSSGLPLSTWYSYNNECGKLGFSISQGEATYLEGRANGLKRFCTFEGGEKLGRKNGSYHGVCPKELEEIFLKGLNIGQREYQLEKKEQELAKKESELQKNKITQKQDECTFDHDCNKLKFPRARCSYETFYQNGQTQHGKRCIYN